MSTRSGKRIHENDLKPDVEHVAESERKTRSRRMKENVEDLRVSAKKHKYVRYPGNDGVVDKNKKDEAGIPSRSLRRNALKEQNLVTSSTECVEPPDVRNAVRTTRSTRNFAEENTDDVLEPLNHVEEDVTIVETRKSKKDKKQHNMDTVVNKKKNKKKKLKKGWRSHSMVVEFQPENGPNNILDKSMSVDSFHSAAGSPKHVGNNLCDMEESPPKDSELVNTTFKKNEVEDKVTEKPEGRKTSSATRLSSINISLSTPYTTVKETRKRKCGAKLEFLGDGISDKDTEVEPFKDTFNKISKKRKSSIKDSVANENADMTFDTEIKNLTFDKIETSDQINNTYDKDDKSETRKSTVVDSSSNSLYDEKNATYDKENEIDASSSLSSSTKRETRKSIIKTTYEKSVNSSQIELIRKSTLSISPQKLSTEMNSTFEKIEKSNSTFDKDKNLDVTFDKSSKSSLNTLDNSNITLDKSDASRLTTSDESKVDIVNTTPVLIESSMDESLILPKLSLKSPVQAPLTPLKREGTFTKDVAEVIEPELLKTPTKRMSLSSPTSPGCTPFHTYKDASREKRVLNVTRSIEKSRRSSLAEPLPRTTKVMFCSPVNNPAVVLQQRRKVIKSNLKGSNKSFVFEERGAVETRAAPRKRSYTQNDAEDARAKRKRVTDTLQHSVNRLSRPRTTSASAVKLPERETPKRLTTPCKKDEARVLRTKLPNFAALHQKEFAKMESLDQCQERRARRAKQLLTPTGGITVLERSSPREIPIEPEKSPKEQAKKQETPVKSLPSFKSINPGFTRFGFKLNLDINPFSIPSKSDLDAKSLSQVYSYSSRKDKKAKTSLGFSSKKDKDNSKPLNEIQSNLRNTTLPSRAGTTSARREVAKQVVMREKSFTDKRSVNRSENRTVIKGVRTNRRFELQMRMRNIDQ